MAQSHETFDIYPKGPYQSTAAKIGSGLDENSF